MGQNCVRSKTAAVVLLPLQEVFLDILEIETAAVAVVNIFLTVPPFLSYSTKL